MVWRNCSKHTQKSWLDQPDIIFQFAFELPLSNLFVRMTPKGKKVNAKAEGKRRNLGGAHTRAREPGSERKPKVDGAPTLFFLGGGSQRRTPWNIEEAKATTDCPPSLLISEEKFTRAYNEIDATLTFRWRGVESLCEGGKGGRGGGMLPFKA